MRIVFKKGDRVILTEAAQRMDNAPPRPQATDGIGTIVDSNGDVMTVQFHDIQFDIHVVWLTFASATPTAT